MPHPLRNMLGAIHRQMFTSCASKRTCFLLSVFCALTAPNALGQSNDRPLYMGTASTGERLLFYGGRAQCGDLPKSDRCWRNPLIGYRLGAEEFNTLLDCDKGTFKEVRSITTGKEYKNIKPSSAATKEMVKMACTNALQWYWEMNSGALGK